MDSGYRCGGDEFAVIIPHATPKEALMVAERLLTGFKDRSLFFVSLSIGMAKLRCYRKILEKNLRVLISEADRALYRAKKDGGNQVCEERGQGASVVTLDTKSHGELALQRKSPSLQQLSN